MTKIYSAFPHINGNLLCAVDLECTGLRAGYHEPIQIAVVPLDSDCRPHEGLRPFYMNIMPLNPARAQADATRTHGLDLNHLCKHGVHPDRAQDLFAEWVESLDLPMNRSIVPLAHNWAYESSFLRAWMGEKRVSELFHAHARDAMLLAISLNDRQFFRGEKALFNTVGLGAMCSYFGVVNERPHDALCDCLAEAEVYRHLLKLDVV